MGLALLNNTRSLTAPMTTKSAPPPPLLRVVSAIAPESDEGTEPQWEAVPTPVAEARRLCEAQPDSATAWSRLAFAAMFAGDDDEALHAARKGAALARDVDDSALYAAVRVLASLGHNREAEELALGSQSSAFGPLLARFAIDHGDLKMALARLDDFDDVANLLLRSWVELSLGQFHEAIHTGRRIIVSGTTTPELMVNLGYAYGIVGSLRKAIRSTETATHLAPASRTAAFNLAAFRLGTGDLDGALREYDRIESFHPDDLSIPFAKAVALSEFDRAGDAEKYLGRVQSEQRTWRATTLEKAQLKANRAALQYRVGKIDQLTARDRVRVALESVEYSDLGVARTLSSFAEKTSDEPWLEEVLARLAKVFPPSQLLSISAKVAFLRRDFKEAIDLADEWLARDPYNPDAAASLVFLLADVAHDYERAVQVGRAFLQRVPHSPLLRNNVAYALAILGRTKEARELLPTNPSEPHEIATRALTYLRDGDVAAGTSGYRAAADRADEMGKTVLADLIRLRGQSLGALLSESEIPQPRSDLTDDPRFELVTASP